MPEGLRQYYGPYAEVQTTKPHSAIAKLIWEHKKKLWPASDFPETTVSPVE
jgi:hypothetical protein